MYTIFKSKFHENYNGDITFWEKLQKKKKPHFLPFFFGDRQEKILKIYFEMLY